MCLVKAIEILIKMPMAYRVVRKLTAEYHEDACAYKEENLLMKYVLTYLPVVYIKSILPYDTFTNSTMEGIFERTLWWIGFQLAWYTQPEI